MLRGSKGHDHPAKDYRDDSNNGSNALLTMIAGFIQVCDTIEVDFHPVDITIPLSATTSMSQWFDPETIVRAYQLNSSIRRN
jgi:hypothetical protein